MIHSLRVHRFGLYVAALLLLSGCTPDNLGSDGLAREAVSGTITMDGKPLDSASIQFIPSDPNSAGGTSEIIRDGKYQIGKDRGPVAGAYKVSISTVTLADPGAEPPMPGEAPKPKKDPIPARYNAKTTLTATIKADVANTVDFALETKP